VFFTWLQCGSIRFCGPLPKLSTTACTKHS
jgi:hypothetical protein